MSSAKAQCTISNEELVVPFYVSFTVPNTKGLNLSSLFIMPQSCLQSQLFTYTQMVTILGSILVEN